MIEMADNLLTMDQYEEVKKILWPARIKYTELYIALGGNPAKLTTKVTRNDIDTTFYNMLEVCLKRQSISQEDIVRAVARTGYQYLSEEIESLKLQGLTEDGKLLYL